MIYCCRLPDAPLPPCVGPPCGLHRVAGTNCVCGHPLAHDPQSHRGWGVGCHRPGTPLSHESPVETDMPKRKKKNSIRQKISKSYWQRLTKSHFVWLRSNAGLVILTHHFLPIYMFHTWKWGCVSMRASSAAVLERCVKGSRSLRISCRSSTLFSLTGDRRRSFRLSSCSWYTSTQQVNKHGSLSMFTKTHALIAIINVT